MSNMFFPDDVERILAGTAEAGRYVGAENYAFRAGWLAALRAVALSFGVPLAVAAENTFIDMQASRELAPVVHQIALQRIEARGIA